MHYDLFLKVVFYATFSITTRAYSNVIGTA